MKLIIHFLFIIRATFVTAFSKYTTHSNVNKALLILNSNKVVFQSTKGGTLKFTKELDMLDGVKKLPLLFLPGLDGVGEYSAQSFVNMSKSFSVTRLEIDPLDRSTFTEIADRVLLEISNFEEPPIVVGESFGGLLACFIGKMFLFFCIIFSLS